MTDSEIIKALENKVNGSDYTCFENYEILELIKRQKAEIERLKSQCENTQIGYNFLKSDFERLKGSTIVNNIMEIQRIKREAKAEAYKEFAAKVKQEFMPYDLGAFSAVRAVLKDLTGEDTNDLQIL